MARQFNLIPPICEQAEYHMFQREKVEVQLPELFHKIGIHFTQVLLPRASPTAPPSPCVPQPPPLLLTSSQLPRLVSLLLLLPSRSAPAPKCCPAPGQRQPVRCPGHSLLCSAHPRCRCHDLVTAGVRHRLREV